jgi:hypothetical protein
MSDCVSKQMGCRWSADGVQCSVVASLNALLSLLNVVPYLWSLL